MPITWLGAGALARVHQQVPGLLGGPRAGGVGGDAQQVHAACLELHDEQDVQAFEEHGVDVQESVDVRLCWG
ncbi:hypothetical protein [Nonomuraea rubra]|uniref:hypothetical protein n=1 Tax=Nonomuraea rubra TaxID=46180 RepID=UPI00340DD04A